MATPSLPKPTLVGRIARYYDEVRVETRKVTWPSRVELQGATGVIVIVTAVFSVVLGLSDAILGKIVETIF